MEAEVLFHKSITHIYLLQLLAHPETSECFFIISVMIFEVKIVAE